MLFFLHSCRTKKIITKKTSKQTHKQNEIAKKREREMNQIQNGWFSEINDQWPGQALSLEVEEILHTGRSKHQDILVFKR